MSLNGYVFCLGIAIISCGMWRSAVADVCLWCDVATTQTFLNCLKRNILTQLSFRSFSIAELDEIMNSILSASVAIEKSSDEFKTKIMNNVLSGELAELIESHLENSRENSEFITATLMGVLAGCYVQTTGVPHTDFVTDIGRTVDFILDKKRKPAVSNSHKVYLENYQQPVSSYTAGIPRSIDHVTDKSSNQKKVQPYVSIKQNMNSMKSDYESSEDSLYTKLFEKFFRQTPSYQIFDRDEETPTLHHVDSVNYRTNPIHDQFSKGTQTLDYTSTVTIPTVTNRDISQTSGDFIDRYLESQPNTDEVNLPDSEIFTNKPNIMPYFYSRSDNRATKFGDTIYSTLLESDEFNEVFGLNLSIKDAPIVAYEIIHKSLKACGYEVFAIEIAKACARYISSLPEDSSPEIYGTVFAKFLTQYFNRYKLIENDTENQARFIATTILSYLKDMILRTSFPSVERSSPNPSDDYAETKTNKNTRSSIQKQETAYKNFKTRQLPKSSSQSNKNDETIRNKFEDAIYVALLNSEDYNKFVGLNIPINDLLPIFYEIISKGLNILGYENFSDKIAKGYVNYIIEIPKHSSSEVYAKSFAKLITDYFARFELIDKDAVKQANSLVTSILGFLKDSLLTTVDIISSPTTEFWSTTVIKDEATKEDKKMKLSPTTEFSSATAINDAAKQEYRKINREPDFTNFKVRRANRRSQEKKLMGDESKINKKTFRSDNKVDNVGIIKFKEIIYTTLMTSENLKRVINLDISVKDIVFLFYDTISNVLIGAGYPRSSEEIVKLCVEYILNIPENSSFEVYVAAFAEIITSYFKNKGLLQVNIEDQAKCIGKNILKYLENSASITTDNLMSTTTESNSPVKTTLTEILNGDSSPKSQETINEKQFYKALYRSLMSSDNYKHLFNSDTSISDAATWTKEMLINCLNKMLDPDVANKIANNCARRIINLKFISGTSALARTVSKYITGAFKKHKLLSPNQSKEQGQNMAVAIETWLKNFLKHNDNHNNAKDDFNDFTTDYFQRQDLQTTFTNTQHETDDFNNQISTSTTMFNTETQENTDISNINYNKSPFAMPMKSTFSDESSNSNFENNSPTETSYTLNDSDYFPSNADSAYKKTADKEKINTMFNINQQTLPISSTTDQATNQEYPFVDAHDSITKTQQYTELTTKKSYSNTATEYLGDKTDLPSTANNHAHEVTQISDWQSTFPINDKPSTSNPTDFTKTEIVRQHKQSSIIPNTKRRIETLVKWLTTKLSQNKFNYNEFTKFLFKLGLSLQKEHTEWGPQKVLVRLLTETVIACTQLLNKIPHKTFQIDTSINTSKNANAGSSKLKDTPEQRNKDYGQITEQFNINKFKYVQNEEWDIDTNINERKINNIE